MKKTALLLAALAVIGSIFVTTGVSAAMKQYKAGDITIENPWARATMSSAKSGAAYLTIKNGGTTLDRLVAARSAIAKKTGVHQSLMVDGMMKMQPVKALDVPPGGMVMLKPGGYHIMFMGLREPLKMGAEFPLTLVFEKSGELEVMVKVMKAGAMGGMKMQMAD